MTSPKSATRRWRNERSSSLAERPLALGRCIRVVSTMDPIGVRAPIVSLVHEWVQLVAKDVQGRGEGLWIGDAHGLGGEPWRVDEGAKGDIPEGDGRREVARLFNDGAVVQAVMRRTHDQVAS